jgi:NADH:ubiquinone oxidoreductase subunit 2 (subunit N)
MGFFSCLIILLGKNADSASFASIQGIGEDHKVIAGAITIIMFSMIGMPPLSGFFGKYYLFYQAIRQEEYLLAFIGIFTSVIAAYYYLNVIKTMYFHKKNIAKEDLEQRIEHSTNQVSPDIRHEDKELNLPLASYTKSLTDSVPYGLLLVNCSVIGFLLFASFLISD